MLKLWSETDELARRSAEPGARRVSPAGHSVRRGTAGARFNIFQRLVRQWDQLHPYNGTQVIKIRGRADLEVMRQAWLESLETLGLGTVCISDDFYHYRCLNGEAVNHGVVKCPDGTDVEEWISGEMNRPFEAFGGVPFRPFVIQESDHFWMGLCYQHWVADSASIRILMREWFVRQFDQSAATKRAVRTHAGGYFSLFGPHREGWRAAEALMSTLRWHSQFRRARRIEDREKFQDMSLRVAMMSAPAGLIDGICAASRELGVTVNDIFLAAIAEACDQYVPAPRKWRRRELAIGTVVDLRPHTGRRLNDVFDLLLGFSSVCCRSKQLTDWNALLRSVARQTRQQKRGGLPLASSLRMVAGLVAGNYLSKDGMVEFYRKRVSLAGANSNVNLNRCWPGKYDGGLILDYVRFAPTGPMTPLVFGTTTLGKGLSVGLTYRPAILPPESAALAAEKFLGRLGAVASGGG